MLINLSDQDVQDIHLALRREYLGVHAGSEKGVRLHKLIRRVERKREDEARKVERARALVDKALMVI